MARDRRSKIDSKALLQRLDIVQVIEAEGYPLKKNGAFFEACCPFHSEKTPSFKVDAKDQHYHCYGCGAHGDAIGFVMAARGIKFREACELLGGEAVVIPNNKPSRPPPEKKPDPEWHPILPVPDHAGPAPLAHPYRGLPLAVYPYRDASGRLLGYTYRLKKSDGGKTVEPLVWARNQDGREEWRWMSFPVPRPLYGLDRLAEKGEKSAVLVVEGEKCADAGHAELPKLAVLAWPGGGGACHKADWTPLAGRRVILFADADAKREKLTPAERDAGIDPNSKPLLPEDKQPGVKTMREIAGILSALEPPCDVWMVDIDPPDPARDGWDIADMIEAGIRGEALADWIRSRSRRQHMPAIQDLPQNDTVIEVDFAAESAMRKEYEQRIEASADFEELVYRIARDIIHSALGPASKSRLLKTIGRKAGISIKTIQDQFDGGAPPPRDRDDVPPAILELNQMHAVVRSGGKTRILIERRNEDGRIDIDLASRPDFLLLYENRNEYLNGERLDLGTAWLRHPARREYSELVFRPGEDVPDHQYNLWRGHEIEPIKGDLHAKFNELLFHGICNGKSKAYEYVLRWMAHLVQFPGDLPGAALVLRSTPTRLGKGTFANVVGRMAGDAHYVELTNQKHLTGDFTGHLERAIVVHASEALWGGDKRHEGIIKAMVTDVKGIIERKGENAKSWRNCKRLIISTNNDFPIPRDSDDARFVVLDCSTRYREQWGFFSELQADMEAGGYAHLMHDLLKINLNGWHPRQIPDELRRAGHDIKILSADSLTRWWYECLWQGWITKEQSFSDAASLFWPCDIACERIRDIYINWCRHQNMPHHTILNLYQIGKKLRGWGFQHKKMGELRKNGYEIPDLPIARQIFADAFVMDMSEWPEI